MTTPSEEEARPYTPSEIEVLCRYQEWAGGSSSDDVRRAEFYRWLKAHDAALASRVSTPPSEESLWGELLRLRDQIEEARTAWWSATEQGDNGLVYTDRIEDAMDAIWSAIGHADAKPPAPAVPEHEWFLAEFSYGTWTECKCGYRPGSQEDMDAHLPPVPAVPVLPTEPEKPLRCTHGMEFGDCAVLGCPGPTEPEEEQNHAD